MSVTMVKRAGRHHSNVRGSAAHRPKHLCSAFDLDTTHRESRCDIKNCDCTVRLSTGSWVSGDASFVTTPYGWDVISADDAPLSVLTDVIA